MFSFAQIEFEHPVAQVQWFIYQNWRSSLIKLEQIWSNKIKKETNIFILFINVTNFYPNIFWLVKNPIWSSLDRFDQTTIFILIINVETFYSNIFWLVKNQFDQGWSSMIHFREMWSKKIQNKRAIFILIVNVATFHSDIFWFVGNPIWFWSDPKKSKIKHSF